jgi:hypothetical protein
VFHAFVYAAAVHYDDLHLNTSLSQTREILAHKCEAIHQLRQALAGLNGALPRDALILAMTYLGLATSGDTRVRIEDEETSPFNPPEPVNSTLWRRQFLQTSENVHISAAKRLIDIKGGLEGRCFILAKSNFWWVIMLSYSPGSKLMISSSADLQNASLELRKPHYPPWDIPALASEVEDPQTNILPANTTSLRASGFQTLLQMGLTKEIYEVLLRLNEASSMVEAFYKGTLRRANLSALLNRRVKVHHAVLSLPTADEACVQEDQRSIYECCRFSAILYSTAVLFPSPPSKRTLPRIASMMKTTIEDFKLETCFEGGGKLLVWALLLGGIASEGTLERVWFLRRLKPLLAMEGIVQWRLLTDLVDRFLWMDSACEDGALGVWEELERPPFL